ncbi:Gp19/Gp15/Gp42 family protein [Corynebacterium variabile]|uniref:Gp19/Gp15/Gp42 family protein n=1 Tax=Corynebacterium variabile TaxID=1727 RepID=UPI003A94511C
MLVTLPDLTSRLPVVLTPEQAAQVETLLGDAEWKVRDAFTRAGHDFDRESELKLWLVRSAQEVIRDMVAAAVLIGPSVGRSSVSSTTGAEADSEAFAMDTMRVTGFARLILTASHREELGLPSTVGNRGRFPRPPHYPEKEAR